MQLTPARGRLFPASAPGSALRDDAAQPREGTAISSVRARPYRTSDAAQPREETVTCVSSCALRQSAM